MNETLDIFISKEGTFRIRGGYIYRFDEGCELFKRAEEISEFPKESEEVQHLFRDIIKKYLKES